MMKATNKFPLEISVIHGTLRNQDLIPAFLEAVLQLDPDTPMALINTMMPEEYGKHRRTMTTTSGGTPKLLTGC
jgi:hypothetical protein